MHSLVLKALAGGGRYGPTPADLLEPTPIEEYLSRRRPQEVFSSDITIIDEILKEAGING